MRLRYRAGSLGEGIAGIGHGSWFGDGNVSIGNTIFIAQNDKYKDTMYINLNTAGTSLSYVCREGKTRRSEHLF